jgi:hypothetical protein
VTQEPSREQLEAARKLWYDYLCFPHMDDDDCVEAIADFLAARDAEKDSVIAGLQDANRTQSDVIVELRADANSALSRLAPHSEKCSECEENPRIGIGAFAEFCRPCVNRPCGNCGDVGHAKWECVLPAPHSDKKPCPHCLGAGVIKGHECGCGGGKP